MLAGGLPPVLRGIFLGLPGLRLTFTACSACCAVTGTAAGVSDLAPAGTAWETRLSIKTWCCSWTLPLAEGMARDWASSVDLPRRLMAARDCVSHAPTLEEPALDCCASNPEEKQKPLRLCACAEQRISKDQHQHELRLGMVFRLKIAGSSKHVVGVSAVLAGKREILL